MGLTDQARIRKYEHKPLSYENNYVICVINKFITKKLIAHLCINYNAIKIVTISNFYHGMNHYHLVRLYNVTLNKLVIKNSHDTYKRYQQHINVK